MYVSRMDAANSCGRGIQHVADFKPSSFFPFQVPWSHGLLAPAQSDSTLWSLLALARPPQSPTGAGSQPREGQVGTVFSLYGTVLPIGKSNFYTPKGYRTLVIIFEKGLFKTEPYWKKSALTQSCASEQALDTTAIARCPWWQSCSASPVGVLDPRFPCV